MVYWYCFWKSYSKWWFFLGGLNVANLPIP
jgi:hypothetical protein